MPPRQLNDEQYLWERTLDALEKMKELALKVDAMVRVQERHEIHLGGVFHGDPPLSKQVYDLTNEFRALKRKVEEAHADDEEEMKGKWALRKAVIDKVLPAIIGGAVTLLGIALAWWLK